MPAEWVDVVGADHYTVPIGVNLVGGLGRDGHLVAVGAEVGHHDVDRPTDAGRTFGACGSTVDSHRNRCGNPSFSRDRKKSAFSG